MAKEKNRVKKTKKQKEHKFSKWFVTERIATLFFDLLMLVLIGCAYIIEHLAIFPSCLSHHISIDIIISLVPAVITVISISIQVLNDKIRGISIREFNKTRTGFYYSLLHMLLVFVVIFCIEAILLAFQLSVMVLALDAVSISYCCIFLIQEIPILTKSDKALDKILKKRMFKNDGFSQEKNDIRSGMAINTIMDIGSVCAFERWKKKNPKNNAELMSNILNLECTYYLNVISNICVNDSKETIKFYNVDVVKAIDNSFFDIKYLLNIENKYSIRVMPKENCGVSYLARLTYSLNDICKALHYEKKFSDGLQNLINHVSMLIYQKDIFEVKEIYEYLLRMSISTLKYGNTWFVQSIRDRVFTPYMIDINENPLTFLLSLYCCFVTNSEYASLEAKQKINLFLDSPSTGLNSCAYKWREKLKKSIYQYSSGKAFLSGCLKIITIKHLLDDFYYEISPTYGGVYTVNDLTSFKDELVFDYLLQLLLQIDCTDINENDIYDFIEKLPSDAANAFKKAFLTRFNLDVDAISIQNKCQFYSFIFGNESHYMLNNELYREISKAIDRFNRESFSLEIKLDGKTLNDIKDEIDSKVPIIFEQFPFVKNDNVVNAETNCLGALIEGPDFMPLVDLYVSNIKNSLECIIEKMITERGSSKLITNDDFSEEDIEHIIDFKPDYFVNSFKPSYFINEKFKNALQKITKLPSRTLPQNIFFKEGAISIHLGYDQSKSKPRRLNRSEIEDIIDSKYPLINGYYRFSPYQGDSLNSFLVSRDELVKLIYDKYIQLDIVFKIGIDIDDDKILFFTFKND